jgi:quinol monooxygenase YgiN
MTRRLTGLTIAMLISLFVGLSSPVSAAQEPVHYTNVLTVAPERADEFLEFITEAAAETRNFEGCQYFAILVDQNDPGRVVFYEIWDSVEAHQAYRAWRNETGFGELMVPGQSLQLPR